MIHLSVTPLKIDLRIFHSSSLNWEKSKFLNEKPKKTSQSATAKAHASSTLWRDYIEVVIFKCIVVPPYDLSPLPNEKSLHSFVPKLLLFRALHLQHIEQ
eukprot:NODE_214_length_14327_cov_0.392325.p11 type:complete len:100 gc:universal NODE_214_length_14327_cov_0.392325:2633-2334(-)